MCRLDDNKFDKSEKIATFLVVVLFIIIASAIGFKYYLQNLLNKDVSNEVLVNGCTIVKFQDDNENILCYVTNTGGISCIRKDK